MIPYEEYLPLLPHEYTYAQFLSYEFDLWMYDSMILNMVSERYPRDEDYASDSVCDSDSVTSEDYDSDFSDTQCVVPRWLFLDQEIEEAASQLSHENNRLEIVFGNFDKNSDLQSISVSPLILIEPEFDEFSIKIGEIICPAIKQSDDEGENFAAPDLDSNNVKEIATGCEFGICDCNNDNVDPDLANQLQKHTVFSEIVPLTSIFVNDSATRLDVNVIFNASKSAKPQTKTRYDASSFLNREVEDEKKLQRIVTDDKFASHELDSKHPSEQIVLSLEKLDDLTDLILAALLRDFGFVFDPGETLTEKTTEKATPELTIFIDHGGTLSSLFFDASTSGHLIWLDFIFTALDLIHGTLFAFGLGTTLSSPKKTTEKETPRVFNYDPGETPTCIVAVDDFCLGYLRHAGAVITTRDRPNLVLQPRWKVLETVGFKEVLLDVLFGLTMVMDHTLCLGSTLHFGPLLTASNYPVDQKKRIPFSFFY